MVEILSYFDLNERAAHGERSLQAVTRHSDAKMGYKTYMPPSSPSFRDSLFSMPEGYKTYIPPSSPSVGESLFSMPEGHKTYIPPFSPGVRESAFLRALWLENKTPPELSPPPQMPLWEQLLMYFAMMIGVIFSSAVMQFKSGEVDITSLTTARVLISAIVAFVIAPVVFEKLTVMTDAPLLSRLGLFVQHGVFWSFLFGSIP